MLVGLHGDHIGGERDAEAACTWKAIIWSLWMTAHFPSGRMQSYAALEDAVERFGTIDEFIKRAGAKCR